MLEVVRVLCWYSDRRLCFTAYNMAIRTLIIASVSALSASVLSSFASLEHVRKYLVRFLVLVMTPVKWFLPVQKRSYELPFLKTSIRPTTMLRDGTI